MFTGIITDIGTIEQVEKRGDLRAVIGCAYDMDGVDIGASIACSGVCLTVVEKGERQNGGWFAVDISGETLARSAADHWREGAQLNLERALKIGDELGGHIVTGHVDGLGKIVEKSRRGDSWHIVIAAPQSLAPFIATKGSITVDGVSLTVNGVTDQPDSAAHFTLNIIPHTADHTTLGAAGTGDEVNLEIDVLARYLKRMEEARSRA